MMHTINGLNEVIWAPNFYLPSIESSLRCIDCSTLYTDIGLGVVCLSYSLYEGTQPYTGIYVTGYDLTGDGKIDTQQER